jgi:hypothetical protein
MPAVKMTIATSVHFGLSIIGLSSSAGICLLERMAHPTPFWVGWGSYSGPDAESAHGASLPAALWSRARSKYY